MTTVSPHQYREQARLLGLSAETIDNALAQAREVERRGFLPILSLKHLAHLTGAPYGYLRSIVSRGHDGYKPFVIRKRSGGQRLIAAPEPILLEVQRWISKNILARHTVHTASMSNGVQTGPPIGVEEGPPCGYDGGLLR